jgi:hypothetical protein
MKCEICQTEVQGSLEVEEVNTEAGSFSTIKEPVERDWLLCRFCNLLVCHECCIRPESGYCNRHVHYFYNFPESEFEELLKEG